MKKFLIILGSGTALIVALIAIVAWLSLQPQSWYVPLDNLQPEVAKLAERSEYRLNEEFHKVRSVEEVWKIRLNDTFMNAWLATRLEDWLTYNQDFELPPELHNPVNRLMESLLLLPPELHNPHIHVTPSGVWIGAMVEIDKEEPRPIAVQIQIQVTNGMLLAEPIALRLGKIPLPISVFLQAIDDGQGEVFAVEAFAPLMDDREVEILSILFEEGALVLECQTRLPN